MKCICVVQSSLLLCLVQLRAEYCRLASRESDSDFICVAFQDVASHVFSELNLKHRKKTDVIVEAFKVSSLIESQDEKKGSSWLQIRIQLNVM